MNDHTSESWTEEDQQASEPDFYGKWISLNDRLPEQLKSRATIGRYGAIGEILTSTDVLVTDGKNIEVSFYYLHDWQIGEISDEDITHWMPLPEPPKT